MADASLREALQSSFDKENDEPEAPTTPEGAAPESKEPEAKEPESKESETKEPETEDEVRAETTPKKPDPKGEKPKEPETKAETPEKPEVGKLRAPGSWTPAAREKWGTLPAEVQREVLKRERDIANGFTEIGRIKQFGQDMQGLWTPFQGIIAAEGGDAMKMTRDLFITAASLYNGSPAQKVQTVAGIIKNFGIDIAMLDSALAGEIPAGGAPQTPNVNAQVQSAVQQALAPILQTQQQHAAVQEQEAQSEIDRFAQDPAHEFFDDVKDTMADLMEVATKRGQQMDLQSAYNRAILMHEDIAKIVQERSARQKAAAVSTAAAAARKKAVSVTGGAPATTTVAGSENTSLRADLESAISSLDT